MNLQEAKAKLKEEEIPFMDSNKKGFDFFIPDTNDDIPISDEENESIQGFGTHMTEAELIEFADSII